MTTEPSNAEVTQRRERGHTAAVIAVVALVVAAGTWWWITRQPPQSDAGLGLPYGIVVVGAGTFLLALLAQVRAMSFLDVMELLWSLVLGVFSLIGTLLKGLWSVICGLFGWD